jgi:two-component system, NtrC family, nitrogen regulation sensor histidine kinase NtrY
MGSSRFYFGIALRVIVLAATITVTSWVISHTQWYVTMAVLVAATLGQVVMLMHFASQSSRKVAHFLDALSVDDTSLTFPALLEDSAFHELSISMTRVLDRLRTGRSEREEQAQYLQLLISHVPVALLSVDQQGAVQLLNMTARRLFERPCTDVSQFSSYGEVFATGMESLVPGKSAILGMERHSGVLQLKAAATELALGGTRRRLISLQNIETELTAQELAAWQSVIRVMTHEVMSSLTPLSSLATTARGLVGGVLDRLAADDPNRASLADARESLDIMAKRSDGLLRFLQGHRRLSRRMVAKIELVPLGRVFARLRRLLTGELQGRSIELILSVTPETLELSVDPELLDQALLNLVRNAMEALREKSAAAGRIVVSAYRDQDDHVVIAVADNGPGIPQELRQKVFVPFFSTKRQGSGVGLTLVRQIVALHGGMIGIAETPAGGATIKLRF